MAVYSPYTEYKKIDLPWFDRIPVHWSVLPNRTLFKEVIDQNHPDEQLLSVTISRGVILQEQLLSDSSKKDSSNLDKSKYKLVLPNDIAYNKMRAWQGSIGISKNRGIISPAYIVQRLRGNDNPRFFHYLFRTPQFAKEAERWSYGISSDQWSLRPEHFKMIYCPVPPLEEQNAIVRYLDHMDNLIKRYIRAKQKQIRLLEDTKWALTHKAIAQGISNNKCLNNSDQDWLGAISIDANLRKLKYVCQINPTTDIPKLADNIMVEFVPMEKVNEKAGKITDFEFRPFSEIKTGFTSFKNHDLIFAKITPCMENGNCAIVSGLHHDIAYGSTEFIVFRANQKIIRSEFLHLLLRDKAFRIECEANMKGSAGQKRISPDFIGNIRVPVFSLEEQETIIKFIYDFHNKVDQSINTLISEIKLLQEFLKVLLADTVTGKINIHKLDREDYSEEDHNFQDIQISDSVLPELEGEIE